MLTLKYFQEFEVFEMLRMIDDSICVSYTTFLKLAEKL